MATERLFRASQEATFAHASVRRRALATRAISFRLSAAGEHNRAIGMVGLAWEALDRCEGTAQMLLAICTELAALEAVRHDTPSAAQCITGAATRVAELAAFIERLATDIEFSAGASPAAAVRPVKAGLDLLVDEHQAHAEEQSAKLEACEAERITPGELAELDAFSAELAAGEATAIAVAQAREAARRVALPGHVPPCMADPYGHGCSCGAAPPTPRNTGTDYASKSERARKACDRCGHPILLEALAVRTVDGLRHDVCPDRSGVVLVREEDPK